MGTPDLSSVYIWRRTQDLSSRVIRGANTRPSQVSCRATLGAGAGAISMGEIDIDNWSATRLSRPRDAFYQLAPGVSSLIGEMRHQSSSSESTRIASASVVLPANASCAA